MAFEKLRLRFSFALPAVISLCVMAVMPLTPAHAGSIIVETCTSDGEVRSLAIPIEKDDRGDDQRDCASPCHAFVSRKHAKENGSRE